MCCFDAFAAFRRPHESKTFHPRIVFDSPSLAHFPTRPLLSAVFVCWEFFFTLALADTIDRIPSLLVGAAISTNNCGAPSKYSLCFNAWSATKTDLHKHTFRRIHVNKKLYNIELIELLQNTTAAAVLWSFTGRQLGRHQQPDQCVKERELCPSPLFVYTAKICCTHVKVCTWTVKHIKSLQWLDGIIAYYTWLLK